MANETTQVIYSMNKVGRIVPPNKQILRDISLGFYLGAKIGVLGLNGAGKSTLLRDDVWAKWSDREVAQRCAVTHPFVGKVRSELSGNGYQMDAERRGVGRKTK